MSRRISAHAQCPGALTVRASRNLLITSLFTLLASSTGCHVAASDVGPRVTCHDGLSVAIFRLGGPLVLCGVWHDSMAVEGA
jgi:hypothetical protein